MDANDGINIAHLREVCSYYHKRNSLNKIRNRIRYRISYYKKRDVKSARKLTSKMEEQIMILSMLEKQRDLIEQIKALTLADSPRIRSLMRNMSLIVGYADCYATCLRTKDAKFVLYSYNFESYHDQHVADLCMAQMLEDSSCDEEEQLSLF